MRQREVSETEEKLRRACVQQAEARGYTEASLNSQSHLVRNLHRPGTLAHSLSTISRQSYVSPEALFTQEVSTGFVFKSLL